MIGPRPPVRGQYGSQQSLLSNPALALRNLSVDDHEEDTEAPTKPPSKPSAKALGKRKALEPETNFNPNDISMMGAPPGASDIDSTDSSEDDLDMYNHKKEPPKFIYDAALERAEQLRKSPLINSG